MIHRSDYQKMYLRDIILIVLRVYDSSHILIKLLLPSHFTALLSCYKQFIKLVKSKKWPKWSKLLISFLWQLCTACILLRTNLPTIGLGGREPASTSVSTFEDCIWKKYYANKTLRLVRQTLTLVGINSPTEISNNSILSVLWMGYHS